LISIEVPLRLGIAAGVFTLLAAAELWHGMRALRLARGPRWRANVSLVAVDTLVVRLLLPAGLVGFALWVEQREWGLLPATGLPPLVAAVLSVLVLDLAIYGQHLVFHRVPFLWRFHRVHHADHDVDVTTGLRFHPVEIALSLGWKLLLVVALGAAPAAVLVFEVLLNATSMFSHANVSLPSGLDRAMRLLLVTPDMHRIHHSVERAEHSSNFGFNLSWWDRVLGTYVVEPAAGRRALRVGLPEFPRPEVQPLAWLLALPWRASTEGGSMDKPQTIIDRDQLRAAIREEYALVARDPGHGFHFHTGRPLARLLGYRPEWLEGMPDAALDSFAGTGNPFLAGELAPGERVVDVGCGAGLDTMIAARMVGHTGRVIGVDMTSDMLERARAAAGAAGASNVELRQGYVEELPVPDQWADVVISNGVLNLAPDKEAAFAELARVVRPGGRLQIGDLLVEKPVPESAKAKIDLWTG
jgi:sterol desaturase/sphingolipid hydroxylase (fatty acid hydroxylase superfamily)/2-polyprenyl-3-methyl-5-hydroxy-6-metoxy-1,4-benzoquinol methylase